MQKLNPNVRKPPLKSSSISQKNKENEPGDMNSIAQKVYYEILHRKDKSYTSFKDLSPKPNRSNDFFSQKTSTDQKVAQRMSDRSSATKNRSLSKQSSLLSLNSYDSVSSNQISRFEDEFVYKGIKVPLVSSKAWVVARGDTGEVIYGRRESAKREVASITKVMTCLCACKLMENFKIDPKTTFVEVSSIASGMNGTSAKLQQGDIICILDLLHGLMLPSGNDAAYCLAESFGTFLFMQTEEYKIKSRINLSYVQGKGKMFVKNFLQYMNEIAVDLELTDTYYSNPHGLCDKNNRSTAADIAKLVAYAMKNTLFRQVVRQQQYSCVIEQQDGTNRDTTWENTNKLLAEGWEGAKTGVTTAAGPCFSGYVNLKGRSYIVVVLGCESMDARWGECKKLVNWVNKNFEY